MTSIIDYQMPRNIERLAEELFDPIWPLGRPAGLPVDAWEEEGAFVVRAALPGVGPKDLNVAVKNGMLEIRAERKRDEERKVDRSHIREIDYGTLHSSFRLPFPVDADKATADYSDGILTVRLPHSEAMKPKSIKVRGKSLPLVGKLLGR